MNKWKKPKNRTASICMEKPVRIFRQMEQHNSRAFFICMEKTVVPLGNQTKRFFPQAILGNKPRISPRIMVRECVKANGSVIFRLFRRKQRKEEYV